MNNTLPKYILQLDLERQRREENDLKRELSLKNAAIEELKMELKNKSCKYLYYSHGCLEFKLSIK